MPLSYTDTQPLLDILRGLIDAHVDAFPTARMQTQSADQR